MPLETRPWNVQDHLQTPEDCAAFLEAVFEDAADDPAFIAIALRDVARSRGIAEISRESISSCEALCAEFSANPSLGMLVRVLAAFGLQLHVRATGAQDEGSLAGNPATAKDAHA
jgi:probable addiction module antidote protein